MNAAVVAAVLVAGAGGAVLRYLVSVLLARRSGFPWAVMIVNVVGSTIGGLVLGLAMRVDLSADIRLIILTGFCGGLTTFSTMSVEAIQLVQAGRMRAALGSVASNFGLGIGAAAAACCIVLAV